MSRINRSLFKEIILQETHLIDVRAPIEFTEGSIPGAINLPLLSNEERKAVGTAYKKDGQETAIKLGHELVSGEIRKLRTQRWIEECQQFPNSVIYCFRGGLRSQIVQQWLNENGIQRPLIEGGYKALRNFLIETIDHLSESLTFKIVRGPTGSGKTAFLKESGMPFVDLEMIANHRGSAFGAMRLPQPTQINFENQLAVELLHHSQEKRPILLEDESRMIGKRHLPEKLFQKIRNSEYIILEIPFDIRVDNIFKDYISHSEMGVKSSQNKFQDFKRATSAIAKKLGDQRSREITNDIINSEQEFFATGNLESNRIWIGKLLKWYYDPMYNRPR